MIFTQKTGANAKLFQKRFVELGYEVKKYDPSGPMIISGMANVASADRVNDVIESTAWELDNYEKNPVICLNHNYDEPIGIATSYEVTSEGLRCECLIGDPSAGYELTEGQKKARSLLAQKILRAFSVGFIPLEIDYDPDTDICKIVRASLLEISVVTVPCQQDSLIATVKSLGDNAMTVTNKQSAPESAPSEGGVTLDKLAEEIKGCHGKLDKIIGMLEKPNEQPENEPMEESMKQLKDRNEQLEKLVQEMEQML